MEKVHPALKDKVYTDKDGTIRWLDDQTIVDAAVFLMYNSNYKPKGD